MSSDQFVKDFVYERGIIFIDGWRLINKTLRGDCDDFATTVLYCEEGSWWNVFFALVTFKAVFWLVHSPSNKLLPRHVVLYYRPRGWIDSTNRSWRDTPTPHSRRLPLLFPWSIFRIFWGMTLGNLLP